MNLEELVPGFPTTPFLFVGSGLARRYYNLPDWESLLKEFIRRLNADEFAFENYLEQARVLESSRFQNMEILAIVAELLEVDFNRRWFSDPSFRCLRSEFMPFIKEQHSPLKVEIAQYLLDHSNLVDSYLPEIGLLQQVAGKSLSGIVTTNYDLFLEKTMDKYKVFIGQEELVFSAIQGLAEIYKIHGSIDDPSSLVLTASDYKKFEVNCPYLAAKLMTIFMEYPIIFIGYSISDPNILMILESIVKCLSDENLSRLQHRFVYLEWNPDTKITEVQPSSMTILGKTILLTKVVTNDFSHVFVELLKKKSALPVKVMRMFREEFYTYTLTGKPTALMRVAGIDDARLEDDDIVLAIGKASMLGLRGLRGLTPEEWYRNIVIGDLLNEFSADDILTNAYPGLMQKNNALPVWRLLQSASQEFPECVRKAPKSFDDVICSSIRRARNSRYIEHRSISGILQDCDLGKAMASIAYLRKEEIALNDLGAFLATHLEDATFYSSLNSNGRSNFNRLIRMYDVLKYGPK